MSEFHETFLVVSFHSCPKLTDKKVFSLFLEHTVSFERQSCYISWLISLGNISRIKQKSEYPTVSEIQGSPKTNFGPCPNLEDL